MIEALLSGTTDPKVLAELAKGRLRKKIPKLEEALEGNFSTHHAFMVGNILAHIDYLEESIARLSEEIERGNAPLCARRRWRSLAPSPASIVGPPKPS